MEKNNSKKKRLKLITISIIVFIGYLFLEIMGVQRSIKEKNKELLQIENDIKTQEMENESLERFLDSEDEMARMERIAREKFDYAYPGEQVFYDMTGD